MILLLSQTSKSGRTSKQIYTTCFEIEIVKRFEFQISLYYSQPLELEKKEDASLICLRYQQLKYVLLKCIPVFVIMPRF